MILKNFSAVLIFFILTNPSIGQQQGNFASPVPMEKTMRTIDKIYKEYAEKNNYPSIVYGIVKDGKLLFTGNTGYSNIEKKITASPTTAFRIASMTKSFVSVAILKLRDEGKLSLDDPASKYIPEMKTQRALTTDAPAITIRHLLTHAAGFPEDNPWGDRQLGITDEQMLAMVKKGISFSTAAGTAYEYSNLGFALLGYIVKVVSGNPYEDYINKEILKPLGMNHTYWEYDKVPDQELALGYRYVDGKFLVQKMEHGGAYGAMGGMITSMEDFAKYTVFQLSAWPARNGTENGPLKRSSIREMHHPDNFNNVNGTFTYADGKACSIISAYGYGIRWTRDCKGRIISGHSGGLPGFGSNWIILPEYGIGIISFSNHTYASASYLNMLVADTLLAMTKATPYTFPVSPILEQRKNELLKLLPAWNNAQTSGIFAVNFFDDYFLTSLRKESGELFLKAGEIIKTGSMNAENNLRGSFILYGKQADLEISFTLSPENPPLIQEYHIREIKR